jgi:MscS family membrane protein
MALWKWLGLLVGILLTIGVMGLAYYFQYRLGHRYKRTSVFKYCLVIILPIFAASVPIGLELFATDWLTIRGNPIYITSFTCNAVALLSLIIVAFAFCHRVAEVIIASPSINPEGLNAQFIRIVSQLIGAALMVGIFLVGGQFLGLPLTTLLASAGVGGLAVALAAQGTLKGLFGTMSILLDKPYRVGERILVHGYDGFVEDIGLRSTKIRTLSGTQVSIPNDDMSESQIENIGRRSHIRRATKLRLPIDSSREKIENALKIVREALTDHEGMDPAFPPRIAFDEFFPDAFNIKIIYWYAPADYWEFMAFTERLNLQIVRKFEAAGVQFSLPNRLSYWATDDEQQPLEVKIVGEDV